MRRLLHEMIEGIKSYKPEVKASKSDKRLRSYDHSKFYMFSYKCSLAHERCSHLLNAPQTPTLENFDIPESLLFINIFIKLIYVTPNISGLLVLFL